MQTKVTKVNANLFNSKELLPAIKLLSSGEIVAFPTETVYGLGANAFNESAVAKIFEAKGRPADNPMIVHVCDEKQLKQVVAEVPKKARLLIKEFWPGPLTLVLKKSSKIPSNVTAGLETIAVRMPSHKVALALIKECGFPIAAPSANSSGKPSPTNANHVYFDLNGKIPLIIDSRDCEIGLESTVLSLVHQSPMLLRPGKITVEEIEKVIGKISIPTKFNSKLNKEKPVSPGMKYRHYSPKADVILVLPGKDFEKKISELSCGKKVGVISVTKKIDLVNEFFFDGNLNLYAKGLFAAFRELDNRGVELIIVEGVKEKGIGLAIMNRLKKAQSKIV